MIIEYFSRVRCYHLTQDMFKVFLQTIIFFSRVRCYHLTQDKIIEFPYDHRVF